MPLNKLDNFIKNTEGRILYVNPSDLDSTDSVTNEGNSLAQPFKTVQRALLEAARFSYLQGNNNDITEKTTILLFPGEHTIDNRPGWAIYDNNNVAYIVPPSGGTGVPAAQNLNLQLDSNFDLTQEDNLLYRFNSVHGGVIVPRGTSIVGLDLRKTKIRPKYVPNPTDTYEDAPQSAIFRITGACYFWQFSIFDGNDSEEVYTNPKSFDTNNRSKPRFSHHKLTCFEYADGVNVVNRSAYGELTDLDMYYHKVGNAYNDYREIENLSKYPKSSLAFAKRAPEWEIVGAFQADPINISDIKSGNGTTASTRITVTTSTPHNLNSSTPIIIRGVRVTDYNISTFVQDIIDDFTFTYLLEKLERNLDASPPLDNATVTIETDTVNGASPYIFNISLRSVWGICGMHADGSKADGFRSMVVAQFTAVSLQKDDRAFVKYDETRRVYDQVEYTPVNGAALPAGSSSTNSAKVYHLDQTAMYRPGWESSHIRVSNDSFIQVVSVFAIGFAFHFDMDTGADASITNSNSNFGQFALKSEGFKKGAFDKDDHAYVTGLIAPRSIDRSIEDDIEWLSLDTQKTVNVGDYTKLYLFGFTSQSAVPVSLTQGYRIGAKENDTLFVTHQGIDYSAPIFMRGNASNKHAQDRNQKEYTVIQVGGNEGSNIPQNHYRIGANNLSTGEKVIVVSKTGDLPDNIVEHQVYFAITFDNDPYNQSSNPDGLRNNEYIKLAASFTYAFLGEGINAYGGFGQDLIITSRVSDKNAGDVGSPIQWDPVEKQWYINVGTNTVGGNEIYDAFGPGGVGIDPNNDEVFSESTDLAFVRRIADERALDEKTYKLRVVIPKEARNAKNPEIGFILQDSSSVAAITDSDIRDSTGVRSTLSLANTKFNRNTRFLKTAETISSRFKFTSEHPHDLKVGDIVITENIKDASQATAGQFNRGYNGSFEVLGITDEYTFETSTKDIAGLLHTPGLITTNSNTRTVAELPRFKRNDIKSNLYIYRNDIIADYIENETDGVYHLYVLNASNFVTNKFTDVSFTQSPVDLYPQLDRDNLDDSPLSARTFAKRFPVGDVATNDLKKSITRETAEIFCTDFKVGLPIKSVGTTNTSGTLTFENNHGLGGVASGTLTGSGSGHTDGVYYNVKLYNEPNESTWNGATGRVTVSGGEITEIKIQSPGSGYNNSAYTFPLTLYPRLTDISSAGSANKYLSVSLAGITTYIGDTIQITGDGITDDSYHRISSVTNNTIGFARSTGDPDINGKSGLFAFVTGPSSKIAASEFAEIRTIINGETAITVGVVTFTTSEAHHLNVGNKFRVLNSSEENNGDYIVNDVNSSTEFNIKVQVGTAITNANVTNGYVLKHGLSANDGVSDVRGENYAARNVPFYAGERFVLQANLNAGSNDPIQFTSNSGTDVPERLKLGDYIQIGGEIFRISGAVTETSAVVSRGYLGTRQENHVSGTAFTKINVVPVEFRRPTICRASAHTFEYLGYGPGNYSTALPQVQSRSLSDREEFLSQAQERGAGAVVYTGMNNRGDTFNGNTRVSAASGETLSYDIPKPTVTGQDPSKLSVAFDELTVRERILVEGGESGFVLSQFDGPVTMTRSLRIKGKCTINGQLRVTLDDRAINKNSGCAVFKGGLGIGNDTFISGDLTVVSELYLRGHLEMLDNNEIRLGNDDDFILKYLNDSDESRIVSTASSISVKSDGDIFVLNSDSAEIVQIVESDSAVKLRGDLTLDDSKKIKLGTSAFGDLNIYHDGNHSYIDDIGTGGLYIRSVNGNTIGEGGVVIDTNDDSPGANSEDVVTQARFYSKNSDGSNTGVRLYHNSNPSDQGDRKRLETRSDGVNIYESLDVEKAVVVGSDLLPDTEFTGRLGNTEKPWGKAVLGHVKIGQTNANQYDTEGYWNYIEAWHESRTNLDLNLRAWGDGKIHINSPTEISSNTRIKDSLDVDGDITAFYSASDINLKENIEKIDDPLAKVLSISGNTFTWKEDAKYEGDDTGVIAQEIEALGLPGIVKQQDDGHKSVQYHKLIPLLIEAVKELSNKVEKLEQQNQDK